MNSGKTLNLVNQFRGHFRGKFDYIVLLYPTVTRNKTFDGFVDNEPRIIVIACQQNEVEVWLKISSSFFKGTNQLIFLDDYAALKDVKGCTSQLVSLGFSARHTGISVWVLTPLITSIAKPFLEIVAAIVLFYTPSSKTMKAMHIASDVPATMPRKKPGPSSCWKEIGRTQPRGTRSKKQAEAAATNQTAALQNDQPRSDEQKRMSGC